MANFLVTKFLDDFTGNRIKVGLLGTNWRRTPCGESWFDGIETMTERTVQKELGFEELQVERKLDQILVVGLYRSAVSRT